MSSETKREAETVGPADGVEAVVCWQMAMENTKTPTGLIFSRQDIKDLPAATESRYDEAQGVRHGGYVVMDTPHPQVVLVGNGSEVSLLCDVAVQLEAGQVPCRVVSVPSLGLFEDQDADYRNSVIPTNGTPVFGLTAGLPSTLRSVVGPHGKVFGLDHFGASAPFKVLDREFGFTVENITEEVLRFLGRI